MTLCSADVMDSFDIFVETAPRKTTENTAKHRNGSVGSVVANHRGGGESSVVVTTLKRCCERWPMLSCIECDWRCRLQWADAAAGLHWTESATARLLAPDATASLVHQGWPDVSPWTLWTGQLIMAFSVMMYNKHWLTQFINLLPARH